MSITTGSGSGEISRFFGKVIKQIFYQFKIGMLLILILSQFNKSFRPSLLEESNPNISRSWFKSPHAPCPAAHFPAGYAGLLDLQEPRSTWPSLSTSQSTFSSNSSIDLLVALKKKSNASFPILISTSK